MVSNKVCDISHIKLSSMTLLIKSACRLALTIALCIGHTAHAQEPPAKQPLESVVNQLLGMTPPSDEFDWSATIHEGFYPIGWSDDGQRFAYFVEPADEACGCYFGRLVVQNVVTDRIIASFDYSGEDNHPEAKNVSELWQQKNKVFEKMLQKNGIRRDNLPKMQIGQTLVAHGKSYPFSLLSDKAASEDEQPLTQYRLMVQNKGKAQLVSKITPTASNINSAIVGYIPAPNGRRFAIVLVSELRGWEGPPNTTRFHIAGFLAR